MEDDLIQFICDILSSQNIRSILLRPPYDRIESFDLGLRGSLYENFDYQRIIDELEHHIKEKTGYHYIDQFNLRYVIFKLLDQSYLVAGPYSFELLGERNYYHLNQRFHFPIHKEKELKEYFVSVPMIISSSSWYSLIITILAKIYGTDFKIEFAHFHFEHHFMDTLNYQNQLEPVLKIQAIEKRYINENQLMEAISKGDVNHALMLVNIRHKMKLEARHPDPIRDEKNLLIVQNTLYRKTAEKIGVHPYYLDQISRHYALMIETIISEKNANYVSVEMTKSYCQLVKKHASKGYSPIIQKIVTYIDLNYVESLSLHYLSDLFHISPSYLSTLFKQELGCTLTDHINQKRIDQACLYLRDTQISITDIASQVGINDLNYFTKVFKKYKAMTPTRYRQMRDSSFSFK